MTDDIDVLLTRTNALLIEAGVADDTVERIAAYLDALRERSERLDRVEKELADTRERLQSMIDSDPYSDVARLKREVADMSERCAMFDKIVEIVGVYNYD